MPSDWLLLLLIEARGQDLASRDESAGGGVGKASIVSAGSVADSRSERVVIFH